MTMVEVVKTKLEPSEANLRKKNKIAIIAPTERSVKDFLANHIRVLQETYDVTLITNTSNDEFLVDSGISVKVLALAIRREISLLQDLSCLFKLMSIFKANRFDLIFSLAPKAGLLALLAGFILRVPVRMHMFVGQIWVTKKGLIRFILKSIDRMMVVMGTHILTDSVSQRKFLESEGVARQGRLVVIADGSSCGVNEARFKPDADARSKVRAMYRMPDDAVMLLFLGRLNIDKGALDLAHAMHNIHQEGHHQIHLLIVGPDEGGMRYQIEEVCASCLDKVHFVGLTSEPELFMPAADIFCLPSYREGLPMTVLEAAACGVPSVASRIYGLTDAVQEGVTGLLHQPRNVSEIQACLMRLVNDKDLRIKMGQAARKRTIALFNQKRVTSEFVDYIDYLIGLRNANNFSTLQPGTDERFRC